ncbi:hypothetical protein [Kibdelosporangium phytohabitans]|uniref:hypothetical protein n=1 Tax=Kibdelosporangium phytohabitans TaxID=860235 RepID=UPI0012FA1462|nr:hypothetical protein [Kibdelosporangium phytohabitans]MBE1462222.1 hypothetical protein [Kibdelosporangium phytohabitans]
MTDPSGRVRYGRGDGQLLVGRETVRGREFRGLAAWDPEPPRPALCRVRSAANGPRSADEVRANGSSDSLSTSSHQQ